ncbi:hypothetical protein P3T27_003677 [Kitasatospora sp. MAA19]|nr:hypothetical protein [Kitasatospora sp. MAA19]
MVHVHLHIPGIPAGSASTPRATPCTDPAASPRATGRSSARALVEGAAERPSESEVTGMTPAGPAVSAPLWEELFMSTGTALAIDPHVVTCTLAPRFEAVRTARDFARTSLQRWGLMELFDDVALVASELVTNALRHAIGARPDPAGGAQGGYDFPIQPTAEGRLPIRISLVHRSPQVVCAVSDPSSIGPVAREADFVAESGRGLHLVESFSRSWGWHPLGSGKVVWALFEAEPATGSELGGRHRRSA